MQTETINQRIRKLIDYLSNGNAAQFARSIRMVQQRFDRLLKPNKKTGIYPMVKPEVIHVITKTYPRVNIMWLYLGEGPMILPQLHESDHSFFAFGVPYYNIDFNSKTEFIKTNDPMNIDDYINIKAYNHADFWCNVSGHSMYPEINHGDMVAMKDVEDIKNGITYGQVYGIVTKDFCTLTRIVHGKNERYFKITPVNPKPEVAEQEILISEIEQLFQVLCCLRRVSSE